MGERKACQECKGAGRMEVLAGGGRRGRLASTHPARGQSNIISPPWTCDAYCVVSLPEPVRRPPPRAARPHAAWESGHLGRLRAGSPHSWPLSQTGTAQGSEGTLSNVICITRLGRERGNVSTSTCSVEGHISPLCRVSGGVGSLSSTQRIFHLSLEIAHDLTDGLGLGRGAGDVQPVQTRIAVGADLGRSDAGVNH